MKMMLYSLSNFGRAETDTALRSSASTLEDQTVALGVLPPTPGEPLDADAPAGPNNVVLLEHVEGGGLDGGTNGLGNYSHGAFLSEGDLVTLRNFLHWSLDAMALYLHSPSASDTETMAIMDAYASVFNVLAEKDRNHLRELFVSVLPSILERCFEHNGMHCAPRAPAARRRGRHDRGLAPRGRAAALARGGCAAGVAAAQRCQGEPAARLRQQHGCA
jgi:hypothetical protein